jgi:hypothetical protein
MALHRTAMFRTVKQQCWLACRESCAPKGNAKRMGPVPN